MVKISIVTPTVRRDSLELIKRSLEHQVFKDFEWLVCSPFPVKEATWIKDDFEGGFWSLNRAYNKLFNKAQGELVVSWQDNIWVPPPGLKKFWEAYRKHGDKAVFSGVGDQYSQIDEYCKPFIKVWADPRKTDKYGEFYRCMWNDCEWNFAAFSKKAIYDIGGMDEKLDFLGYGGDQLQVCERWNDDGYEFWLDQTNESFTLRHGRKKNWDKNNVLQNGKYDKRKEELKESRYWPHLEYLK